MIQNILESLASYSLLEWTGLITGIIYVALSARNNIICWIFGIVSCACIAYSDFFGGTKLYSDGVLQIFYILMAFWGIHQWRKSEITPDLKVVNLQTLRLHAAILIGSLLISGLYGWIMNSFSDAAFAYIDAFTTVFSISASILLVYRFMSAWIYFFVIDLVMTILYFIRAADLYAVLYLIFTFVAIYAVWNWSKLSKAPSIAN